MELTDKDLIKMLKLSKNAKIYINVPTGADWSGMQLIIGEDCNLLVISEDNAT
jgi:hypothetical protein